ncbi:MAG TPA: ribbon-helix-helix protein, CopG family [Candidatus Limnocylindria bacterium]|nr:ribbon-helix-helix protein, CopG family [Candidatus Limnocylindria bacterium]
MKRTTIMVDEGVLAELDRMARRQRRPTAHLIRESLERYVTEARLMEGTTLPAFVAMDEGPGDVADQAEAILRSELPAVLRRETGG